MHVIGRPDAWGAVAAKVARYHCGGKNTHPSAASRPHWLSSGSCMKTAVLARILLSDHLSPRPTVLEQLGLPGDSGPRRASSPSALRSPFTVLRSRVQGAASTPDGPCSAADGAAARFGSARSSSAPAADTSDDDAEVRLYSRRATAMPSLNLDFIIRMTNQARERDLDVGWNKSATGTRL